MEAKQLMFHDQVERQRDRYQRASHVDGEHGCGKVTDYRNYLRDTEVTDFSSGGGRPRRAAMPTTRPSRPINTSRKGSVTGK
jgi:hypothetical protein